MSAMKCSLELLTISSSAVNIKRSNLSTFLQKGRTHSESGHACMIGCMEIGPPRVRMGRNLSLDCEIVVDIQYHSVEVVYDEPMLFLPVNPSTNNEEIVNGTIKSTREKSDGLYFEPFEFTSRSIHQKQAEDKESMLRMDLEITMVLISNTISCICVGLQLLHVKRHANALPLIFVVMFVVLTLGHLIPMILNFEALFATSRTVNFYFGVDEWLEVNEVLVRVITMIAFFEFRLLQMAWSSRSADKGQKNLWTPDMKVLYPSTPLYISCGLIAWFVHLSSKPHKITLLWDDMKLCGGLIFDGFLLPQTLFNLYSDSKEKVLAPSFYVGTSVARLLPHAYNLYRSISSTSSFGYMYAIPGPDYYLIGWGLSICCSDLPAATVWRTMPYTQEILAKLNI